MNDKKKNPGKLGATLARWFRRLMFPNKELDDIYAEEQLQSPFRMVVRNYFSKPMSVVALFLLIVIMLFVFIAPNFVTLDLGDQDSTLVNVAPGFNMMDYPSELKANGVADIAIGNNFAVGADRNGKVYTWGKTKLSKVVNIADVPDEVRKAKIVKLAAGADHVVALDDQGRVYSWGNGRLGQTRLPSEIIQNNTRKSFRITDIQAGNQYSAALADNGEVYLWGNTNTLELDVRSELQGHVKGIALADTAFVLLMDDGSVQSPTTRSTATVSKIPEGAQSGVVKLAYSTNTIAALKSDGTLVAWGATTQKENRPPEFASKVVDLEGGRYHYTAILEDGSVVSWGGNRYKQSTVPASIDGNEIESLHVGSFQNYAVMKDGSIETWGLKGFIMGTDSLGRDVFARLVNGGKMTMTIGALSVVIETIIGVILGGLAGYFGGWVDLVIMRISEVIGSMPFIPFAMILSAVMGTRVTIEQRMYIIMVILGVLSWPGICRLVRAQMLAQREMEYVTAAKTMGVKEGRIIFKHVLPNVMSVCLVTITLAFGTAMLTESTLSYLGFGVPLPTPTWGNMLTGANNSITIQNYWWNWVFVGAIFGIACICINLIGDGLRDALDPKVNDR